MDLNELIAQYGLSAAIGVWLIIGLARLIKNEVPGTLSFFRKSYEDRQEHLQELEQKDSDVKRLEYLAAMGSRTFTEEQLTQMTAEAQSQLGEANEFIRKEVWARLDIINQKLGSMKEEIDTIPDNLYNRLRDDLRPIAENWKATMLEYRHVQTKMTLIITLLEELSEKKDE